MAAFRNLAGGEIHECGRLLAESGDQAVQRVVEWAEAMEANCVVASSFITAAIMGGASETLVYGTTVLEEDGA
jgi:uncharacterized protein YbjQ (UPF0145 family)